MNLPLQMPAVPRMRAIPVTSARSRNIEQPGRVRPSWTCLGLTPDACMCPDGTHACCASGAGCCCTGGRNGTSAVCC